MIEMLDPVVTPGSTKKGGEVEHHYEVMIRMTVSKRHLMTVAEKATADYIAKHDWNDCTASGLQRYIRIAHGLEVSISEADYLLRQALGMV